MFSLAESVIGFQFACVISTLGSLALEAGKKLSFPPKPG